MESDAVKNSHNANRGGTNIVGCIYVVKQGAADLPAYTEPAKYLARKMQYLR